MKKERYTRSLRQLKIPPCRPTSRSFEASGGGRGFLEAQQSYSLHAMVIIVTCKIFTRHLHTKFHQVQASSHRVIMKIVLWLGHNLYLRHRNWNTERKRKEKNMFWNLLTFENLLPLCKPTCWRTTTEAIFLPFIPLDEFIHLECEAFFEDIYLNQITDVEKVVFCKSYQHCGLYALAFTVPNKTLYKYSTLNTTCFQKR